MGVYFGGRATDFGSVHVLTRYGNNGKKRVGVYNLGVYTLGVYTLGVYTLGVYTLGVYLTGQRATDFDNKNKKQPNREFSVSIPV